MTKKKHDGTRRQKDYISYLESLTGLRTSGSAGSRIKKLRDEAAHTGTPVEAPTGDEADRSVRRAASGRPEENGRSTREFFFGDDAQDESRD